MATSSPMATSTSPLATGLAPASIIQQTRNVPERVRNYQPQTVTSLIEEGASTSASLRQSMTIPKAERQPSPTRLTARSPMKSMYDSNFFERQAAQRAAKEAELKAKEEEFKRETERRMQEAARRKEDEFQEMYSEVLEGLSNSSGIMGDTDFTLKHKAKIHSKKKAELYDAWDAQVFQKIQDRLQKSVDSRSAQSIERRLKEQMDQYLTTTNSKLGVFRDVIIEEDYNPMTAHQHTIKIPTGDILDPVKKDMLKPLMERRLMGMSSSVDSLPVGKTTLDVKQWDDLHIHATPYGHCMDKTGQYIVRPMSGGAAELRKSRVPMDHYNYPNHDNEAVAAEMPKGKRIVPGPEVIRGRKDLFDVMQNTVNQRPNFTGGDRWLEAKGKVQPAGPEERRGRKDLREVIQQTSNPYVDGRSLGDQWLEHKGKANAPGPEQRRGRRDLGEIIQQSSNPYKDGRTLGDNWLEHKGKQWMPSPTDNDMRTIVGRQDNPVEPAPPKDPRSYLSHLQNDKTLTVRRDAPRLPE